MPSSRSTRSTTSTSTWRPRRSGSPSPRSGIGFLGEPALAALFEPVFGNVLGHTAAIAVAIAVAFTIVTFLHVILGEQAPKMLAIARAERSAARVSGPLKFFRGALHPLIVATNVPANFLVQRVFRVDRDDGIEETSPEELRR